MDISKKKVNLFAYRDYRDYLKEWYAHGKQRRTVSFRSFAKKAGLKSTNFFMLVLQGKRNLTEESLKKFSIGLGLNKQEEDFFRNLVFFNQAKSLDDKDFYYRRLIRSKKISELRPIEKQQYEYYSAWYHPVVRELVCSAEFDGRPDWIASRLSPTVTTIQAGKSIELLEKLEFIKKNPDGRWSQPSTLLSTGPELTSLIVHNYHKLLLDLSKNLMDQLPTRDRDVSSLTLGVKKEKISLLREKIREFRQEILKLVSEDTEPEEVFLLNMQFFPVTQTNQGGKSL